MNELRIEDGKIIAVDQDGNRLPGKLMVGVTVSGESMVWFIPDEEEVPA